MPCDFSIGATCSLLLAVSLVVIYSASAWINRCCDFCLLFSG